MNEWAEFRHFLYLSAIIEHGGVRAAAEVLHASAPNLSIQATEFQEYFDVLLYERDPDNRLLVTEAGAALPPMAHGLFRARDEVLDARPEGDPQRIDSNLAPRLRNSGRRGSVPRRL